MQSFRCDLNYISVYFENNSCLILELFNFYILNHSIDFENSDFIMSISIQQR